MKTEPKFSILIPDGESPILILIINCFSLQENVKVYVMSSKKACHMRYSRFVEKYIYYQETSAPGWIDQINTEVERNNIDVILPVYEHAIEKLLVYGGALKHRDKLCYLPDLNNFRMAQDKGDLLTHLESQGFLYPKSTVVKPKEVPTLKGWKYPVIVKPVKGFGGGREIEILKNYDQVLHYFEKKAFECDTIVQDFIEGYDICSNVLCKDGDILAYSCQRGREFEYGEQSSQIAFDFIDNKDIHEATKRLMKSLNWSGPANIDWRYDENDGQFKVIEINVRFWGNINASALAGINFPYLYCLSSLGENIETQQVRLIHFMNLKGLVRSIERKPLSVFNFRQHMENSTLSFSLSDPLPMVYKFFSRTYNILIRRQRD